MIYDAREHVFDRLRREAAASSAEEVVGIKTYIIELGPSLVEIFAVGTAVRQARQASPCKTPSLPAQAIIRDKDTWLSGRADSTCNRSAPAARGRAAGATAFRVQWRPIMNDAVDRPPLPPFDTDTAAQKVRMAEDAWNSRDPARVALAYTRTAAGAIAPNSSWAVRPYRRS